MERRREGKGDTGRRGNKRVHDLQAAHEAGGSKVADEVAA